MNSQVTFYTDNAEGWERALYAFLGEKQRRSGSLRTVDGYSRMLQHFFGRLGKAPDQVTSPEVFAWSHGKGLSGKEPSAVTIGARMALPLILLLLGSGCRRAEVSGMTTDAIDWDRGRIIVHGKGGKEHWVAPGPSAMSALRTYIRDRRGQVFEFSGDSMYKLIRKLAQEASVVGAHCHRFRVTFAVMFLRDVGNLAALKEILGHEEIKTTEHYATFGITEDALEMQSSFDLAGRQAAS